MVLALFQKPNTILQFLHQSLGGQAFLFPLIAALPKKREQFGAGTIVNRASIWGLVIVWSSHDRLTASLEDAPVQEKNGTKTGSVFRKKL